VTRPFSELTELGRARRLRPLAMKVLARYDLVPTRLRLIDNGWNCVFRVDSADGPRVLRVTRPAPADFLRSVASEVEFMTALAAATDIAVPTVIANRDGGLVTVASAPGVSEPRACVLFGWLPGTNLSEHVSPATWEALGDLVGKMHRFSMGWQPSDDFGAPIYDSVFPYDEPVVMFEPGRVDLLGLEDLLRRAYEVTTERIDALNRERRRIVVHADLHGWNIKVHRGVLSPFDFEDLLWAMPILDVATSLFYVRDRPDYADLGAAFRAGYERHQPWVESEPGELDRLFMARSLDTLNTVAHEGNLDVVDDWEAFMRRREQMALVALGEREPVEL
jgi:Ser/Thr protein kinase RdoA (MazF antagonist)